MSKQNTKLFLLDIDYIFLWLWTDIQQAQIIRCINNLHIGWIDDLFLKFKFTVPLFQVTYPCNPVYDYWIFDSPKCKYYNRIIYSLRLKIKIF